MKSIRFLPLAALFSRQSLLSPITHCLRPQHRLAEVSQPGRRRYLPLGHAAVRRACGCERQGHGVGRCACGRQLRSHPFFFSFLKRSQQFLSSCPRGKQEARALESSCLCAVEGKEKKGRGSLKKRKEKRKKEKRIGSLKPAPPPTKALSAAAGRGADASFLFSHSFSPLAQLLRKTGGSLSSSGRSLPFHGR